MTTIKICGLTTVEATQAAIDAGADYIGFVFAPSKRQIQATAVACLLQQVTRPKTVKTVGVFVSPTRELLLKTAKVASLDFVQIHGDLPDLTDFPLPVIAAQGVEEKTTRYQTSADFLLLDAPPTQYQGGNGQPFDWSLIHPENIPREKLWLAGGLTIQTVAAAIRYFQPLTVDVSSGVETNGQKDLKKIHAFCQAVKEETYVSRTE